MKSKVNFGRGEICLENMVLTRQQFPSADCGARRAAYPGTVQSVKPRDVGSWRLHALLLRGLTALRRRSPASRVNTRGVRRLFPGSFLPRGLCGGSSCRCSGRAAAGFPHRQCPSSRSSGARGSVPAHRSSAVSKRPSVEGGKLRVVGPLPVHAA